eukprot:7318-Heterococcus_DN1.PRE.1
MLVLLFVVRPLYTQLTSAADAQIRGTLAALQETEQRASIAVELLQGLSTATTTTADDATSSATDSSSSDVAGHLFSALLMRHLALRSSAQQQATATSTAAAEAAEAEAADTHLVELEEQCVMIIVAVLGEKLGPQLFTSGLQVLQCLRAVLDFEAQRCSTSSDSPLTDVTTDVSALNSDADSDIDDDDSSGTSS